MYKIYHIQNNTEMCNPDHRLENELFVSQIGHSTPPHGYASNKYKRNVYALHFIISGKGRYNEEIFEGPCIMLGTPEDMFFYSVDSDRNSPGFEQYWVLFGGSYSSTLLKNAGFPLMPAILPCPYMKYACQILCEMQSPHFYAGKDDNMQMLAGLYQLMALHAYYSHGSKTQYSERVQRLIDHIHENYSKDISEDSLAQIVHLSTRYMHRVFKNETGIAPIQYINSYRIYCAQKLLKNDDLPINIIATICGFATHNYFCYVFRKYNKGMTPLEYRNIHSSNKN